MKSKRKRHVNEHIRTSLANSGRIAGTGILYDDYSETSYPNYYSVIPATVRYDRELKASEKLLYSEITALANKNGCCWAGNNYFAELYGVHKTTVSKWISSLEKQGYIKVVLEHVENTKQIEKRYIYINDTPIGENAKGYWRKRQGGISEKTNTPIGENAKDNNTSINNTSINNIYIPFQEIVDSYNSICTDLPKVQKLTDKRKRTIKARWKDYDNLDTYKQVFQKAEESDFLSGRNGKWTSCNFDWLLNENNMIKVLEGNYENKGGGPDGPADKKTPKFDKSKFLYQG